MAKQQAEAPRPVAVDSSKISQFTYDPDSAELTIDFTAGQSYRYYGVPRGVVDGLRSADSAGRFHHQNIARRYRYERL